MTTFSLQTANELIHRVVPGQAGSFIAEPLSANDSSDRFEMESHDDGRIILRGNTAGSIASALYFYLTRYCNAQITWNGTNLNFPPQLPTIGQKICRTSPHKFRYYLNYCTFSYTTPWWDWERWEKEIDWMALHGINMPLAVLGQNSVWLRTYRKLGFSDEEITPFFSGPAYVGFNWMGVLDGWGGPFPESLLASQEELQKKILLRMRELGMIPVLPAFTGHVPAAFAEKFPESRIQKIGWEGFPPTHLLDPHDNMFVKIGETFINELKQTYGTDHYYSADTFIEMVPPSGDSGYLTSIAEATYMSMAAADPEAVWVMQGWMFQYLSKFWGNPQIGALLRGVPDEKMVILDLYSECRPVWDRTEGYFGKQWLWCMLHNFGGNLPMYGHMNEVAAGPSVTANTRASQSLRGIGMTMEGLEQNPVMYELMSEHAWSADPIALNSWINEYILRRYGQEDTSARAAWEILRATVYNGTSTPGMPDSIITRRPAVGDSVALTRAVPHYDPALLARAWSLMINASERLADSDGFHYDLVDITRQVLANYAELLYKKYEEALSAGDRTFHTAGDEFLQLIEDMDRMLASRKDFLLGRWLNAARNLGTCDSESAQYERNARNILTTWGDKDSRLHDYVKRQWSGLLAGFYRERWKMYFQCRAEHFAAGTTPDAQNFSVIMKQWEWNWVNAQDAYLDAPSGDSVQIAAGLYEKYYARICSS